jgi:hypothetical protein
MNLFGGGATRLSRTEAHVYRAYHGSIPRNDYLACRPRRIRQMIGMRLFGESLASPSDRPLRTRRRRHHR